MLKYTHFIQVQPDEIRWSFGSEKPSISLPKRTRHGSSYIEIDPFPCMGVVDIELVKKEAEKVQALFPIGTLLTYAALPYEFRERTNAWAQNNDIWDRDTEEEIARKNKHLKEGTIVFTGRRTIIHPALVKYLVAHEYGHHVDYWVTKKMNLEKGGDRSDEDLFRKEYAEFRKLPESKGYYAGDAYKHSATEIIANDFRIVVCKQDVDIYPHYVENPHGNKEIKKYWKDLIKKYSFKDE